MLYLIKTNYGVISLLKIGYTNDLESRLKTYKTHNPLVELISSRDGGPELEHYLHEYFSEYSYSNQPEWFYFNDYIVDNFLKVFLKVKLDESISKEKLISILNHKIGSPKPDIKVLEDKYIEKYGKKDFQLRREHVRSFWDESLLGCLLEGNYSDTIPINSKITIRNLPFGLNDISFDLPQILGRKLDPNSQKNQVEFYCRFNVYRKGDPTQNLIDKKLKNTEAAISLVENTINLRDKDEAIRLLKYNIINKKYKSSYVSLSYKNGKEHFVVNNFVLTSEQRAFNIQKAVYADRFSALNTTDSTKEVEVESSSDNLAQSKVLLSSLDDIIYQEFKVGDRLSNKEIKSRIKNIYLNNQIKLTPKANDIERWFQTKPCTINLGGKRINGLELIKKLEPTKKEGE